MNMIKGRRKAREYTFLLFYRFQLIKNESAPLDGTNGIQHIEQLQKDSSETLGIVENAQVPFVAEMIKQYCTHKAELEITITKYLTNWKINRLNPIDLTSIYLAYLEIKYFNPPTPIPVVINEYVELSKNYGNEQSGSFVNGILEKLSQT